MTIEEYNRKKKEQEQKLHELSTEECAEVFRIAHLMQGLILGNDNKKLLLLALQINATVLEAWESGIAEEGVSGQAYTAGLELARLAHESTVMQLDPNSIPKLATLIPAPTQENLKEILKHHVPNIRNN